MNIIRTNKNKPNWYWIIKAFTKIFDSLIILLSLGYFWSDLEYKFTKYNIK